jgi:hypothetical protein
MNDKNEPRITIHNNGSLTLSTSAVDILDKMSVERAETCRIYYQPRTDRVALQPKKATESNAVNLIRRESKAIIAPSDFLLDFGLVPDSDREYTATVDSERQILIIDLYES